MRFTKYLIDIDLKCESGEHLLINGGNGLVDILRKFEYSVFCNWTRNNFISDEDKEMHEELIAQMVERGYIVDDEYDEEKERNELIYKLVAKTEERIASCKKACFIPTYGCNFACPYCYEQTVKSTKRMTKEQVDKIFSINNNDLPYISFFGGEPLLPGNREIIEYIISKAPNASYSMITNGYYLEEYFDIFFGLQFSNIQVTLDGSCEVHNKTRILKNGAGTFDKIMAGIKLYAEHGIPITIRMNVTPENYQSCKQLKEQVYSFPWATAIKMEMQLVFQVGSRERTDLTKEMFLEDIQSAHKNEMLKRQSPLANFLYSGLPLSPITKSCNADSVNRFYDPEGDVYSCILSVGNPKKRIATYGKDSEELIFEPNSMLKRNIATVPSCMKCKYALICGGGCPNAIPDNMNMLTTPNCGYFISEIENEIPEIYKLRYNKR